MQLCGMSVIPPQGPEAAVLNPRPAPGEPVAADPDQTQPYGTFDKALVFSGATVAGKKRARAAATQSTVEVTYVGQVPLDFM